MAEVAAGEATREVLGEAIELGGPRRPGVIAVGGDEAAEALAPLGAHGAGRRVHLRTAGAAPPSPPEIGAAIAAWLLASSPPPSAAPVVLLPHTRHGLTVGAQLAARLDAALAPDAVAVRRTAAGDLEIRRPAYGDRLHATLHVAGGTPAVVTLRPGALGGGLPSAGPATAPVETQLATVDRVPPAIERRAVTAPDPRTVDLREAERIVAGGRGVGASGFPRLAVLAELLGAAVGGSRVAVDEGWIPWERQVGQSGRTVAPALYLAFGISGASQHLDGIRDARTVVAVNADRAAPLLARAQLAAVADWQPVVDAMIERLRARRASR